MFHWEKMEHKVYIYIYVYINISYPHSLVWWGKPIFVFMDCYLLSCHFPIPFGSQMKTKCECLLGVSFVMKQHDGRRSLSLLVRPPVSPLVLPMQQHRLQEYPVVAATLFSFLFTLSIQSKHGEKLSLSQTFIWHTSTRLSLSNYTYYLK